MNSFTVTLDIFLVDGNTKTILAEISTGDGKSFDNFNHNYLKTIYTDQLFNTLSKVILKERPFIDPDTLTIFHSKPEPCIFRITSEGQILSKGQLNL